MGNPTTPRQEKEEVNFKLTADNLTQKAYEYLYAEMEKLAAAGETSMDIWKYEPSDAFIKFLENRGFVISKNTMLRLCIIYW